MFASAVMRGENANPVAVGLVVVAFLVALFIQVRYGVLRLRSKRWPKAAATAQQSALGIVTFQTNRVGPDYTAPASFFGCAYSVEGVRYAALFVLYGVESKVQEVAGRLVGQSVQVRYDPARPDTSFLVDYEDSRFQGLTASQRPDLLEQAPEFDLRDAMRGSVRK